MAWNHSCVALVVVLLLPSGCYRSGGASADDDDDSDFAGSADAGPSPSFDAGPRDGDGDDPVRDAGSADAGDAGAPDLRLARALSCELTEEQALDAVVRHVACDRDTRATTSGLYEAWEAGLFGSFEPYVETTAGFEFQFGCERWQCVAEASSCAEHDACLEGVREGGCGEVASRCDGTVLEQCRHSLSRDSSGFVPVFDCAAVGASCLEGTCQLDGCSFGGSLDGEMLQCDGQDVSVCDGAAQIPCGAWRPGTTCQYFAIGGEIPTRTCLPGDFGGAGAYARPVDCSGERVSFTSAASGRDIEVDCAARGYSGCDERGCVP